MVCLDINGIANGNNEFLNPQAIQLAGLIRGILGLGKLKSVTILSCHSAVAKDEWLTIAENFNGYTGVTGNLMPPAIYCIETYPTPPPGYGDPSYRVAPNTPPNSTRGDVWGNGRWISQ